MEAFQISYDARPQFGAKTTFNITRYADLIHTMILEVDLPQIQIAYTYDPAVGSPSDYAKGAGDISWVNNTGHAILNFADLLIGKQLIDRNYGEWMEIWTQLTTPAQKIFAGALFVGLVIFIKMFLPFIIVAGFLLVGIVFWKNVCQ